MWFDATIIVHIIGMTIVKQTICHNTYIYIYIYFLKSEAQLFIHWFLSQINIILLSLSLSTFMSVFQYLVIHTLYIRLNCPSIPCHLEYSYNLGVHKIMNTQVWSYKTILYSANICILLKSPHFNSIVQNWAYTRLVQFSICISNLTIQFSIYFLERI